LEHLRWTSRTYIDNPTDVRVANPWKLCVPREQRQRVLEECHNHPSAGHLGIRKTLRRISQLYFWPGLQRNVVRYVTRYMTCQQYQVRQRRRVGTQIARSSLRCSHTRPACLATPRNEPKGSRKLSAPPRKPTRWSSLQIKTLPERRPHQRSSTSRTHRLLPSGHKGPTGNQNGPHSCSEASDHAEC